MKKVIYCKYNLNRAPEFQTKTVIYQDDKNRYIEKYPLTDQANIHMDKFERNYKLIKGLYPKISFITCERITDGIRYPYITGIPMDEVLKERIYQWDDVLPELKKMIDEIYQVNDDYKCEFKETEGFQEVFGTVDCKDDSCVCPCNLDMIFDNLMLVQNKITAFDYEWVCDFPVPEKYIIYRVLCRFYDKYLHYVERKYSFEEYIGFFDFTEDEKHRYRKMEDAFIKYVYANGDSIHQNEAYKRSRMSLSQVKDVHKMQEECKKTQEEYNKVVKVLHNTEKEYLSTINRLDEAARLKMETDQELVKVTEILHKTEREYVLTIERLNEAARLKVDADATIVKQIEEINNVTNLLHSTEKEYLLTIERLNEAAKLKMEADNLIHQQEIQIQELIDQKKAIQNQYDSVVNSKVWKITRPLRLFVRGIQSMKIEGLKATLRKIKNVFQKKIGLYKTGKVSAGGADTVAHEQNVLIPIIEVTEDVLEAQSKVCFEKNYKISIITPLFNTPQDFLVELFDSVQSQTYLNWEFCVVNFSTTDFERVDKTCKEYAEKDVRISYHVADENRGISENTNTCISYATGDYIGLLDHDDVLHPSALYEVMKAINETDADFVYTDEVKFNENIKNVFLPNFKPDFSADELRAHNYICHFNVYKTELYYQVGGYRKEFDGSQDHDIVLRLTEKAEKIVHIPKILYYWRVHPNSVAQSINAKSYATDAGVAAVTEQLERMGEKQYVQSVVGNIPLYRIRTDVDENADLTVIIWNTENAEAVEKTVESVKALVECDVIILKEKNSTIEECMNSIFVDIKTKYALVICAGLELQSDTFVKEFMIYARRNDIATIDCKVLTESNTIYSGGACMTGDEGMPIKLRCMGGPKEYSGYENGMYHCRNVTASAGLCTFVDVELWKESKGFESKNSKCFMLEYSYKMWKDGKNNLWIPFIEAVGLDENLQKEYISGLCSLKGEYDKTDAYVSEYVSKLHLE